MEKQIRKSAVDLTDLAIGIVVLGIVVSIGSTILITMRDSRLTSAPVVQTVNESTTNSVNETGVQLDNTWVTSIDTCINANMTAIEEVIEASNYTLTIDDFGVGTVAYSGLGGEFNNSVWNCTYNRYDTTDAVDWSLANDAAVGLGEYGNWFGIIVIVGVAALVLSLIFLAFGGRGGGTGGEAGGIY